VATEPCCAAHDELRFGQLGRYAEDLLQTLRACEAAYQQLFAYVQDLQRVIRERDRALEQAQAAAEAKNVLLANMSHEFRTPLTSILGFAELLVSRSVSAADRDLLARIHRAGRRVEGLVENLLTMARIDSGAHTAALAPCDLAALLRDECARFASRA
jgi:signal transduction histidine kinase